MMGEFNIGILPHDTKKDSAHFLDEGYSDFLLPYLASSFWIISKSKTLIENIFSNVIKEDTISGCISSTMSNHCIQIVPFKDEYCSKLEKKLKAIRISKL